MSDAARAVVAIVDFGLGNLYSVKHACAHVGLAATITASETEIMAADALILPGVGAFGDAMRTLEKLDLVRVLRAFVGSGRPLVGICLGMQLLMTSSEEFGSCAGLDMIPGRVVRFQEPIDGDRKLKVPQIGWNGVHRVGSHNGVDPWTGTLLQGIADGEPMYFVHSFVVTPADQRVVLSTTRYGHIEYCSSILQDNIFACQFHPERSGLAGLRVYDNLAATLQRAAQGAQR